MRLVSFLKTALLQLSIISCALAQTGLPSREPIGPYLNGKFPATVPAAGSAIALVNAFPNLTFEDPIRLFAEPGSSRAWVLGRSGNVWMFDNNPASASKTMILDIHWTTSTWGDGGMMGLAFHPQFNQAGSANRNYVYLFYDYSPAPNDPAFPNNLRYNRLSRFTVNETTRMIQSSTELVLINQMDTDSWHSGGDMFFGPDGFLYLTLGDEGGVGDPYNNSQKIDKELFSGVLRIDVDRRGGSISHPIRRQPQQRGGAPAGWPGSYTKDYFIPNDNPWQDAAGGTLEEFYAIGLRNPHRMTRDSVTGKVFIGDVGQSAAEEVNLLARGANYQWSYREGNNPGYKPRPATVTGTETPPFFSYQQTEGNTCIIGGFVYRGTQNPLLAGKYVFGDHVSGRIWTINAATGAEQVEIGSVPSRQLSGFGMDAAGEVYLMQLGAQGTILKFASSSGGVTAPALLSQTGAFSNLSTLTPVSGLLPYGVNSPLWSDGSEKLRWIAVPGDGAPWTASETVGYSAGSPWTMPVGTVLVKHFELPVDERNPSVRTRLETRFMVNGTSGWYGLTYRWRADGLEADLLGGGISREVAITTLNGGTRKQVWSFPGRNECMVCHNTNAGSVLGLQTWQMNGMFTYPSTGTAANQISAWNSMGLFNRTLTAAEMSRLPAAVPVDHAHASLETRVRSFAAANCAHCHQPGSGTHANMDARFTTPLQSQQIVNGSVNSLLGVAGAAAVKPRELAHSLMHVRMGSMIATEQMPPLGRNVPDQQALDTFAHWIASLRSEAFVQSGTPGPPVASPDSASVGTGGAVNLFVLANDSDPNAPLYYGAVTIVTPPQRGKVVVNSAGNALVYTHNASLGGAADSFTYRVSDPSGLSSSIATVSLTVTAGSGNRAPVLPELPSIATSRGLPSSVQARATDADGQPLSFSALHLPQGLTINAASGLISGTLPADAAGTNSVTVTVSDGALTDSRTFTWLAITPVSPVPSATDFWALNESSGTSAANSVRPLTGSHLNGVVINQPGAGPQTGRSVRYDGADEMTSLPALNYNADTFTATLWVKRNGVQKPRPQLFYFRDGHTDAGLGLSDAHDLQYHWDGSNWDWSPKPLLAVPDNEWVLAAMAVSPSAATLYLRTVSGLQRGIHYGAHPVQAFEIAGALAADASRPGREFKGWLDDVRFFNRTLSMAEIESIYLAGAAGTVLPNRAPVLAAPAAQTSVRGQLASLQLQGSDPDGNTLTYSATGLPAGLSINPATGLISGTVAYDAAGANTVTATVSDGLLTANRVFNWITTANLTATDLWALNESSGTTAANSIRPLNGTHLNGVAINQPGVSAAGRAALYDGLNDRTTLPALNYNTASFTAAIWLKRNGAQKQSAQFFYYRGGSTDAGLGLGAANELRYHWEGGNWDWVPSPALTVPDNQWVLAAMTVTPGSTTLYLHTDAGLQKATNTGSHGPQSFDVAGALASDATRTGREFKGSLDEVRFYNRALTQQEIESIYFEGKGIAPFTDGESLLRYAFGLNAAQTGPNLPPTSFSGESIVCEFTRPQGVTGISYAFQWSPSLAPGSWTNVPDTGVFPRHSFSVPRNGRSKMFTRLVVTAQ